MMDRTSTILAVIELDSILLRIDRFIFVLKQVYALLETSSGGTSLSFFLGGGGTNGLLLKKHITPLLYPTKPYDRPFLCD